jgi:hypothetical protein
MPDLLGLLGGRHRALLGVTLWMVGLFVALVMGMLSAYLLATGVYLGSRVYARLRAAGAEEIRKTITGG